MIWQSFLLVIIGLSILVYGADLLVRGASRLAFLIGMSPLLIGLTVVSFGTSAPELAISLLSSHEGVSDIAFGNVIGSNLFNTLAILGISSLIVPLVVQQKLIRIDVPFMIIISFLVWLMSANGALARWEGGLLTLILFSYLMYCGFYARKESREVQQEYQDEFTPPSQEGRAGSRVWNMGLVVIGLVLLVAGSKLLVNGAVEIASFFGVSELVIGLTIVSAGTSLPELATSVIAAMKKEQDIAVGNIIGSNIFNLLAVLGLTSLVSQTGMPVSSQAIGFDLPFMIASALACLPIFFVGNNIDRWEGVLFVVLYASYLTYTVMSSMGDRFFDEHNFVFFALTGTLIGVTLLVLIYRYIRFFSRNPQT